MNVYVALSHRRPMRKSVFARWPIPQLTWRLHLPLLPKLEPQWNRSKSYFQSGRDGVPQVFEADTAYDGTMKR